MTDKPRIGLGLIGSGFMGRAHAFAFAIAERVFDLPVEIDLAVIADIDQPTAERARKAFGFRRATGDWRTLLDDPEVQIVDVTSPNRLHHPMAMAAIAAGKHVYCEKPLAPSVAECVEMRDAAAAAGIVTQVGFNYLKNPIMALAAEIVGSGEIGEVRAFRGVHAEDYMASAAAPWTWRLDPAGGGGAMADLGSHVFATATRLCGPVAALTGDVVTMVRERRTAGGEIRPVTVEDIGRAFVRFQSGATGTVEANWMATGRKMQHDFELYGSKGGIAYCGERLNELRLFTGGDARGREGFRTILAGPEHEPYGAFCVAPGHQLGFNDLKAIEVRDFLTGIAGGARAAEDFGFGAEMQALVAATYRSAAERREVTLAEMLG